ncbi:RluA family pseudouridine synthase [Tuwongella immobilis]|uniref:Pseudouridine synthase RsuA/RluA-like domain-containing protein n=1 Tax=Tuwongella immobilis TaxID=692036 RepID=A0A6C2YKF3_9BACT|nr:RluA family pseudouridine synthase [Tuwongella immobilis]VIP01709.1 pseudouridine synthase : Pseudouridine synthase OS=Singulisphaera acidiphila (strain ATCC BAA-1392 / DSM 18658 / VKM B-2454 / MOB10) GN=Sinac_1548 PE=3 SV=1: PseudoU_synth_2 [Tuwongella immobilis]VTR99215.1 pseudouridine synthase : Pseudouridine synthase OS=Singulisphaera acidiphila (strain ATCC BAA-1392 / DSM 18658 / VKM B-2454 / MOB10) GN=Sinac_1548 PE=3 SV=1: PseudoU_synth_2 [Tuwongella immobilis]
MNLHVLYEDNHCIAVAKPPGVPSAHFDGVTETVDRMVRDYLKAKYSKPGNVFLGVVHRLDKPVSGVLLFARTSKAAARLSEQFRLGTVEKRYWAVVEGTVASDAGTWEDWLAKEDSSPTAEIVRPGSAGGKCCRLHYRRLADLAGRTALEIQLETGRRHQIRVQAASRGHPILGDAKYGHPWGHTARIRDAIALHARSLEWEHPTLGTRIRLQCDFPEFWREQFAPLLAMMEENG